MEQLQSLTLARKLILGGAVLLLIDTFLNWQQIDTVLGSAGQSAWHGFWGVLIGLMTVALVAWGIARMFGVQMPEGVPEGLISLILGGLILLFAIIKIISDDFVHWPAYVGILLAAVVTYGAWRNFQESGEAIPALPRGARQAGPAPEQPVLPAAEEPPPADTDQS